MWADYFWKSNVAGGSMCCAVDSLRKLKYAVCFSEKTMKMKLCLYMSSRKKNGRLANYCCRGWEGERGMGVVVGGKYKPSGGRGREAKSEGCGGVEGGSSRHDPIAITWFLNLSFPSCCAVCLTLFKLSEILIP